MINERCLDALRAGATLAHALPLRLRLHHEGVPLVTVARPPFGGDPECEGRLLTPCSFRAAVGEAWRLQQAGQPVAFCGLPDDSEVAVSVGVPPGATTHPGGIYQMPWPEGLLTVFATTVCPALTAAAVLAMEATTYVDRVTGVSLVQLSTAEDAADDAVTQLEDALAAVATAEVMSVLA